VKKNDKNEKSEIKQTWERPDAAVPFHTRSPKIFVSVVTDAYTSSNYGGETGGNYSPIQFVRVGDELRAIIGSSALRNGMREGFAEEVGHENINRYRLHDQQQPAVGYRGPQGEIGAYDCVTFGYLRAKGGAECLVRGVLPFQCSSVRVNHALGLSGFTNEKIIHQVPHVVDHEGTGGNKNAEHSSLITKDVVHTRYQYVVALDLALLTGKYSDVPRDLFRVIGQFANVAGNHARTLFDMSPASLVGRVTRARVPQFNTYAWTLDGNCTEIARLNQNDLLSPAVSTGNEWYIAGEVVRKMSDEERERLLGLGVHLDESPQNCLNAMVLAAQAME